MPTTSDYLTQLKKDKKNLVNTLISKGVTASNDETFTSLVPKVNDIKSQPNLQNKTVNPSEESIEVVYDEDYDGLNKVTVNPMKSNLINGLEAENIKRGVQVLDITGTYGATSQIKHVTPKRTQQIIIPDEGIEFLSQVTVNAVNNTVDEDIIPSNIKRGVEILGVEGTFDGDFLFQTKTVTASTSGDKVVNPDEGYDAMTSVTVKQVTSDIDSDITPENIRRGVEILGVQGTYAPDPSMEDKRISPQTYEQVVYPDEGYSYFDKVTIEAVNKNIDANIKAENIKENVNILGVTGQLEPVKGEEIYILPSTETQVFVPDTSIGKNAITKATVMPVTHEVDDKIISSNIKEGISILGVTGTYNGGISSLQAKTVTPTDKEQQITADAGYDALSSVTIEETPVEDITIEPSMETKTYNRSEGTFINSVTVNQVTSEIDANIQPENIKQNMSILGVVGTYSGENQNYFGALNKSGTEDKAGLVGSILSVPDDLVITVGQYQFSRLTALQKIPTLDYSALTNCSYMFYRCESITDTKGAENFSQITNATYMFSGCKSITYMDVSSWDVSKLTTTKNMFHGCIQLKEVNCSGWNCTLSSMDSMFGNCSKLETTDFSNTEIIVTSRMYYLFAGCQSLTSIDLSGITFGGTANITMTYTFYGCSVLRHIDMRNMDLSRAILDTTTFQGVPTDCEIIVRDDNCKTILANEYPTLTNVKTVDELGE